MSDNSSPGKARILVLFFAFTVLFIVVFSLGVIVGKGLNKEGIRLTKKFDEPVRPTLKPAAEDSDEDAEKDSNAEPVPEPEPETEMVEQERDTGSLPEALPEPEREKIETKPEPVPVKTPAPVTEDRDERLAKITREIEREIKSAQAERKGPEKNVTLPPVSPDGLYTVQIGSFQDQNQANKLAHSLQSKGYPVFIKSMTTPDKKNWYRVRVGTFSNVETATAYGEGLKVLEPEVKLVFITANN